MSKEFVDEYVMADGRRIYLLGEGRLINLVAAEGHPASVMDMSFSVQALMAEYTVRNDLPVSVHAVPREIDELVAGLKLKGDGYQDRCPLQRTKRIPRFLGKRDVSPNHLAYEASSLYILDRTVLVPSRLRFPESGGFQNADLELESYPPAHPKQVPPRRYRERLDNSDSR